MKLRVTELLLALATALTLWYLLREKAPMVERALSVPLQVVGLGENRLASGLPKEVLLRIRGPAPLVEGTPPISAYLDLSGVEGSFSRPVQVAVPQGVEVVEIGPARAEGQVEALVRRRLPVYIASPEGPAEPEEKSVEALGPKSQVERAQLALGLDTGQEEVRLFAFGEEPLPNVQLEPDRVRIRARTSTLIFKELPLRPLVPEGYEVLDFSPKTIHLVGPKSVLDPLEGVEVRLPPRAGLLEGPLELLLPPGVSPIGVVVGRARVEVK
ncbi:MAG: CdaR family protein [Thermaceae bacterium]